MYICIYTYAIFVYVCISFCVVADRWCCKRTTKFSGSLLPTCLSTQVLERQFGSQGNLPGQMGNGTMEASSVTSFAGCAPAILRTQEAQFEKQFHGRGSICHRICFRHIPWQSCESPSLRQQIKKRYLASHNQVAILLLSPFLL